MELFWHAASVGSSLLSLALLAFGSYGLWIGGHGGYTGILPSICIFFSIGLNKYLISCYFYCSLTLPPSHLLLSWIYARKWPAYVQGPQLSTLCSFLTLVAWLVVISPIAVLLVWGSILIALLERNIIGLAVTMAGVAFLLSFYSIMLWWRTQWQSSSMLSVLFLDYLAFISLED